MGRVKKAPIPKNLLNWQKKYGPGYVMYSTKTGRVLVTAPDYKKLSQKAEKLEVDRDLDISVIYVPSTRTISIF